MKIAEITGFLETIASPSFQEPYDNCGLLTGDTNAKCSGLIVCLDCIEAVVDEAISKGCNLIIAHHPIIFKGLKKIAGKNYVESTIIKAIKNDIAIYAIHTNLDNVKNGVNGKMAQMLGLKDLQILKPREAILKKLVTFSPLESADKVRNALFKAGGGEIGKYSECSFNTEGFGTFKPMEGANPHTGQIGQLYKGNELKIEVIFPSFLEERLLAAMKEAHPYEEVAYEVYHLGNFLSDVGSGIIGNLEIPVSENAFLDQLKTIFLLKVIKHTAFTGKKISRVAVCGGAGSFLLSSAINNKADIFITSDVKYHEFFDTEKKLLLADIGHFESEQFTIDLLYEYLKEKFRNFAVLKTGVNTNPVHYFT